MPALDRASRASAATVPLGREALARSAIGSWVLRIATAAALGIDTVVHWQNASAYDAVTGTVSQGERHCCIEPKCAGEAQQSGGSPSWKGAKKGPNHSTVPMICRLRAAKWRQSHGVIAQCNSAVFNPYRRDQSPAGQAA